jgi:hypothetical protein
MQANHYTTQCMPHCLEQAANDAYDAQIITESPG